MIGSRPHKVPFPEKSAGSLGITLALRKSTDLCVLLLPEASGESRSRSDG